MPSKADTIKSLTKPMYGVKEVRSLITAISKSETETQNIPKLKPLSLRVGDIIRICAGVKFRPAIVIKVNKKLGLVFVIPLTTNYDEFTLKEVTIKSRFLKDSFFCKSIIAERIDVGLKQFIGVMDDKAALKQAKNIILDIYKSI